MLILFIPLQSCRNKESNTVNNKESRNEVSEKSSKKTTNETNENTIVSVEATISDKKFSFGKVDTRYSGVVVLFKSSFQIKYVDTNDKLVLVHFYDSDVYKTPNTFTLQIPSLPQAEQANVKVKASKLALKFPNKDKSMWLYNTQLYEGVVHLTEFTKDKISISFKGKGYPYGDSNSKGELLPVAGKITIENYGVYDAR